MTILGMEITVQRREKDEVEREMPRRAGWGDAQSVRRMATDCERPRGSANPVPIDTVQMETSWQGVEAG